MTSFSYLAASFCGVVLAIAFSWLYLKHWIVRRWISDMHASEKCPICGSHVPHDGGAS